jgi:hypothetical protein
MAENLPYRDGTIKLTWIEPSNYKVLHSQMFNSVSEALNNLPKKQLGKNWLLFKLTKSDGIKYEWELLPYGQYVGYINGMKLRDNPILKYGSIALMIFGGYALYKTMLIE